MGIPMQSLEKLTPAGRTWVLPRSADDIPVLCRGYSLSVAYTHTKAGGPFAGSAAGVLWESPGSRRTHAVDN